MLTHSQHGIGHFCLMGMGHKIKIAREEAGFTSQRALADALKVSNGLVGAWESHNKVPGRANLQKLAKLVGKPLSYFLDNVLVDQAALEIKDSDEIELVMLFREFTPSQRANHLGLFRQSATIRREIEAESKPSKRKKITA